MNKAPVTLSIQDSVATVIIDDGKANALNRSIIDPLLRSLGAAEADARAVVVAGRPGMFCAGLDTNVLRAGDHTTTDLFHRCTELILRLAEFPRPVVAACTGHALATGAVDAALLRHPPWAPRGDFKIGFNEVSLGMPMPELGGGASPGAVVVAARDEGLQHGADLRAPPRRSMRAFSIAPAWATS